MNDADWGSGYTGIFQITLMLPFSGLPGTGADIQLTSSSGGQWDGGFSILEGGSGYLPNVNQVINLPASPPHLLNVSVNPGGTYVIDIEYGAGERFVNVEGFEF